jgi:hypothetical protein
MMRKKIGASLLFMFMTLGSWAQSYTSVTTVVDTVTVGDPFEINLLVSVESEVRGVLDFSSWNQIPNILYDQDTINFSEFADYAILEGGKLSVSDQRKTIDLSKVIDKNATGNTTFQDVLKLAIYDVGIFEISGPSFLLEDQNFVPTEPVRIVVILPPEIQKSLQDSVAIAPIKPIIEEPLKIEDFKYIFIILGLVILISLLYYYLVVKKKQEPSEPIVILKYTPPHLVALEKLQELKQKQLWQQGNIKDYQSELTYIIREYLENRFEFGALEMTTGEILARVPNQVNKEELQKILQIADLVKFAKANPPEDLHSQFLDLAVKLVNDTKLKEEGKDD